MTVKIPRKSVLKVEKFVAIGNLFTYAADTPMSIKEENLFYGLTTDAHCGAECLKRNLALFSRFVLSPI